MRRAICLFLVLGAAALSASRGSSQPASQPKETRTKAFSTDQTFGPPPEYSIQDVAVLLERAGAEEKHYRKVTITGAGPTAYVQIATGESTKEKAESCSTDETYAVLGEAYRVGFFRMGNDYTTKASLEMESPGTVTTWSTTLLKGFPRVTITIRIGSYSKTVTAPDGGEVADRYETPKGLLELADFILSRPSVTAITEGMRQ